MKGKKGFTLVEMLAVIAVIGVLIGLVIGLAGLTGRESDDVVAQAGMQVIRDALEEYRIRNGVYPEEEYHGTGGQERGRVPASVLRNHATDWYQRTQGKDPWGVDYRYYRESDLAYHLWSSGPSGRDHLTGSLPTAGHELNRDNIR